MLLTEDNDRVGEIPSVQVTGHTSRLNMAVMP